MTEPTTTAPAEDERDDRLPTLRGGWDAFAAGVPSAHGDASITTAMRSAYIAGASMALQILFRLSAADDEAAFDAGIDTLHDELTQLLHAVDR